MPHREPLRAALARQLATLMRDRVDLDTQQKVARRAGLAQSTVGRILRAEVSATLDNVEALAIAFGVTPGVLMGEQEPATDAWAAKVTHLPRAEVEKINAFIDFTLAQAARERPAALNFRERTTAAPEQHAAMNRAAQRPLSQTTLAFDQPAKEQAVTRRAKKRSRHA